MLARKSSATWLVSKIQHLLLIGHYFYLPASYHNHVEEEQLLRGEVLGGEVELVTVTGKVEKGPRKILSQIKFFCIEKKTTWIQSSMLWV